MTMFREKCFTILSEEKLLAILVNKNTKNNCVKKNC